MFSVSMNAWVVVMAGNAHNTLYVRCRNALRHPMRKALLRSEKDCIVYLCFTLVSQCPISRAEVKCYVNVTRH